MLTIAPVPRCSIPATAARVSIVGARTFTFTSSAALVAGSSANRM
jgi:hypothetical protein